MKAGFIALASAGLCMSGCASVLSSQDVASLNAQARSAGRADGEVYFLPRAVITAHVLVKADTGIEVALEPPKIVVDYRDRSAPLEAVPQEYLAGCVTETSAPVTGPFVMNYAPTGFHKDEITVEVEDGLLKTANAKSEEQISLIAPKLAESFAMLESDPSLDGVYSTDFDPGDCRSVAAARYRIREAILKKGLPKLKELKSAIVVKGDLASRKDLFQLDLDYRPFRFPGGARPSAADCAKGICVPVLTPAYVSMGSGNGQKRGSMMMLPNGADPAVIPIDRSPFANVDTKLSLNGGVLIKREVSRTSEALTIVSVPAAIVGAYLDAIAGVFTKRKAALDAKVAYQEAVEALEKKQADPSKVGDGGVKQEAAITGGIGFSIGIAGAYKAPAPILSGAKKEKPVENDGQAPVTSSNDGH